MGTWDYYTVKMSASELSQNVKYASEVHDDRTLDKAIQRRLDESRVKKDIVEYLKRQPNRFFSAIVVAALNGNPQFYPVKIADDPQLVIFRNDSRLSEAFGVLQFDGTQKYYALDGQHRLSAIKTLLEQNDSSSDGIPENFENDEISVIVVVPNREDSNDTFMQKYRRLFSNLNRYAKPMDQATNIIMDEDDTFAILTRRLITDVPFFQSVGKQRKSRRIKTKRGKNLTTKDPYFTSIETLYEMNITLLSSARREPNGWGAISEEGTDLKTFVRFRPSDEYIDNLYDELAIYWEALLTELPILRSEPTKMRIHSLEDNNAEDNDETDHLLFWPIGQQMLAEISRVLLDEHLPNLENPTLDTAHTALSGLSRLEWKLHQAPWCHFLLVQSPNGDWAMRNEQRIPAVRCGRLIQQWILGLEDFDESDIINLKKEWASLLIPAQSEEKINMMWQQVEEMKVSISG
jgi:DGQHR domain-containing protein